MNSKNFNISSKFLEAQYVINSALHSSKDKDDVVSSFNSKEDDYFSSNQNHINLDKTNNFVDDLDVVSAKIYPNKNMIDSEKMLNNYILIKKHSVGILDSLLKQIKLLSSFLFEQFVVYLIKIDKACEEKFISINKYVEDISNKQKMIVGGYKRPEKTNIKVENANREMKDVQIRYFKVRKHNLKPQQKIVKNYKERERGVFINALILVYKELRHGNVLD